MTALTTTGGATPAPANGNAASDLIVAGQAHGPPQLAMAAEHKGLKAAATGAAAGLVLSIVVLAFLLTMCEAAKVISLVTFVAFLGGASAATLAFHGRFQERSLRLADAHAEIERKAIENRELREQVLKRPQSSRVPTQKQLEAPAPEKKQQPKKNSGGKKR